MSRYGGFRKGKKRYTEKWDEMKAPSALRTETVADTPSAFSYVEAKGIWSLRSTTEFPKSNSVGAISLTFVASSTGTASVSIPAAAQPGDIVVFYAAGHGTEIENGVDLPSGWNGIRTDYDAADSSMTSGYKILGSSDLSSSIAGFSSANTLEFCAVLVFRPSRTVSSVTTFSVNGQATVSDPTAQTINMALAPAYNSILAIGLASATTTMNLSYPNSMSILSPGQTTSAVYRVFNKSDQLSNLTIDIADLGDNVMQSFGLAIN